MRLCKGCGGTGSDIDRVRNVIIASCEPDKPDREKERAKARAQIAKWYQMAIDDAAFKALTGKK